MKTRQIGLLLAAVAVLGFWFGRLAWRAHRNLVTLHVRNMPLAKVVRSLEWQTWEKIKYDKRLRGTVTLNVKDAPLDTVLDLTADRVGARWQKTLAVGTSADAMSKLESALSGDVNLDTAGWTNVAPPFAEPSGENGVGGPPVQDGMGHPLATQPLDNGGPVPGPMPPGKGRIIRRIIVPGGGPGGGGPVLGRSSGPNEAGFSAPMGGQILTTLPDGTTDQWNSEQIVIETALLPQAGTNFPTEASAETAQRLATTVHGRSQLYYDLAPAPFGMGGFGPGPGPHLTGGPRARRNGPGAKANQDIVASITQAQRQRRLQELSRSPEEQVERARQRSANEMHFQTSDEDKK